MELAPGPKELMNTQRFYLYLNLTKPSEHLCLSYSLSNGKGEPISPAYLIHSIQALYPGLEVKNAGDEEFSLNAMELPGTSLECFPERSWRGRCGTGKSFVYSELYSWYLRSPKYRTLAREAGGGFQNQKACRYYQRKCGKGSLWRGVALQCHQAGALFCLCFCPFPPVWSQTYGACRV